MKLQNKLILSFLLFSNIIFCQQNQDIIIWKANTLEWKHFQNLPQDKKISNAQSNVNLSSRWKVTNLKLSAIILSEFSKSKSWLRGKETKDLLKHEQGHFDIIEYYSRLFRKELATYKFESLKNLTPFSIWFFVACFHLANVFGDFAPKSLSVVPLQKLGSTPLSNIFPFP